MIGSAQVEYRPVRGSVLTLDFLRFVPKSHAEDPGAEGEELVELFGVQFCGLCLHIIVFPAQLGVGFVYPVIRGLLTR